MERRSGRGRRQSGPGDHDIPYAFGMLPTVDRPYPFRLMQYARLLFMRGRLLDGAFREDREGMHPLTEHQGIVWIEGDGKGFSRRSMERG